MAKGNEGDILTILNGVPKWISTFWILYNPTQIWTSLFATITQINPTTVDVTTKTRGKTFELLGTTPYMSFKNKIFVIDFNYKQVISGTENLFSMDTDGAYIPIANTSNTKSCKTLKINNNTGNNITVGWQCNSTNIITTDNFDYSSVTCNIQFYFRIDSNGQLDKAELYRDNILIGQRNGIMTGAVGTFNNQAAHQMRTGAGGDFTYQDWLNDGTYIYFNNIAYL